MKNGLLTIGMILALICVGQAKDKLTPSKDAGEGSDLGNNHCVSTMEFFRCGCPSWKFSVDNGPDLIVRNGTTFASMSHRPMTPVGKGGARPQKFT